MNSPQAKLTLAIPVVGLRDADPLGRTLDAIHNILPDAPIEVLVQIGDPTAATWAEALSEHPVRPGCLAQKDAGIYDAFNALMKRASGERILFLGAGDLPLSGLVRALDRWSEVDDTLELGGVRIPNAEPRVPRHYAPRWDRGLRWRNVTHHQGIAYPLPLLRTFGGFPLEYPVLGDYALHLEMWREGVQARWGQGEDWVSAAPGGVSRQFNAALYAEERRLKKAILKPGFARWAQPAWTRLKARWKGSGH